MKIYFKDDPVKQEMLEKLALIYEAQHSPRDTLANLNGRIGNAKSIIEKATKEPIKEVLK